MIIKLPHIEAVDTLNLPSDFDELIKYSFSKFTEMTAEGYRDEDRLNYLDRLRTIWLGPCDSANSVKNMVTSRVEYELSECGDYPDKDEFWSFDFMCDCYELGVKDSNFYSKEYERRHRNNDITLKVIARIIRIVMNWDGDLKGNVG